MAAVLRERLRTVENVVTIETAIFVRRHRFSRTDW
jgi:hypothetical protein